MNKRRLALIAALGLVGFMDAAARAQTQWFYSESFETRYNIPEWSTPLITDASGTVFTKFLGRFLGERETLTINLPTQPLRDTGVPGGGGGVPPYVLAFDFYCIDSWDGYEPTSGPDRFRVLLNQNLAQPLLSDTFANQHTGQSYPYGPDIGRALLGFTSYWNDSVYHITIPFNANPGTNQISFEATGLLSLDDESWGIDNVRVGVNPVPAPGAAAVLALGLIGAVRRRRR